MEAKTYVLDKITYKRKEIDKGIILGERPFRWTLKKKYSPCFAKDVVDGEYCSELSPHKQNFKVYIPVNYLKTGKDILIYKKDYKRELISFVIHIVKVDGDSITLTKEEA